MALIDPVEGAIVQFDSFNVDGRLNNYRNHGDVLKFWHNGGDGDDAIPASSSGEKYARAMFKKSDTEASVAMDGIADRFDIPGSDSSLAFIHNTAVFDMFLSFRAKSFSKPIIGSTHQASNGKGLTIGMNSDGTLFGGLGDGTTQVIFITATDYAVPLFVPTKVLIRGTGTSLQVSNNFFDFEDFPISNPLGSGNSVYEYAIGEVLTNDANIFQGDFFWCSVYDRNLNQTELDTMAACIRSRAGDQA